MTSAAHAGATEKVTSKKATSNEKSSENPSTITKNSSQGILFVIMSCQRVHEMIHSELFMHQEQKEHLVVKKHPELAVNGETVL